MIDDTSFPLCVGDVRDLPMFSLVHALPSTTSAATACCSFALFGGFTGTMARSDSSTPFMPDVRLFAFSGRADPFPVSQR